jgi:hypothetical protein
MRTWNDFASGGIRPRGLAPSLEAGITRRRIMTKTFITSAALLAALVLLPLDSFAQRGGDGRGGGNSGNMGGGRGNSGANMGGNSFRSGANVGPSRAGVNLGAGTVRAGTGARVGSGFGIGFGPGGIYAGPTRGWYGGRYGWYGGYPYGRYGYGYGYPDNWGRNYAYSDGYYSSPTYSQTVVRYDYDGPGVAVRNVTDQTIHFTIDDHRQMSVGPNETIRLSESPQFLIAFDRGSNFGTTRYTIHEGLYEFTPTQRGWELFRQKADDVVVRPNEDATPRTAERLRPDPLPPPATEGRFDGEFRDADGDLRDPDLRDHDLPPPVPHADNPADDY